MNMSSEQQDIKCQQYGTKTSKQEVTMIAAALLLVQVGMTC